MNAYLLTLRRLFRSVGFPLFLLIVTLAIFAAPFLGREESLPPAAVLDLDKSEISQTVVSRLTANGFVLCDTETALRQAVREGVYDCGVILPPHFGEMLERGELEQSVTLVNSPTSFFPELYQTHVASAVYSVYAPYMSASYLEGMGIPSEAVIERYNEGLAEGKLFSFDIVMGETAIIPENERAKTYTVAAGAMLLFALLAYGSCDVLTRDCSSMIHRIGVKQTMLRILVPGMAVRVVCAAVAGTAALLFAAFILGEGYCLHLILPTCIYTLLLAGYSIGMCAIFKKGGHIQIVSCFVILLSLVLCPIYTDLALMLPWVGILRYIAPPYWLWAAVEHPLICLGAAIVLPTIATLLLSLRWRRSLAGKTAP